MHVHAMDMLFERQSLEKGGSLFRASFKHAWNVTFVTSRPQTAILIQFLAVPRSGLNHTLISLRNGIQNAYHSMSHHRFA